MFLHIGGDVVVLLKEIIAIFDLESALHSDSTKEFLKIAEEEGFIRRISEEEPRSFIITEKDNKSIIYFSPISSVTLYKRAGFIDEISFDKIE